MVWDGVYVPHIVSVKEEHEKMKQKYPLTFADTQMSNNVWHIVYYRRFSPFPIGFICDIWSWCQNGFKQRKIISAFHLTWKECILSVPEEVEKRFPKHKKKEYLNYVLLSSTDTQEIAEKLAVYIVDVLGRRWKEAEPHIFKYTTPTEGNEYRVLPKLYYETRILETWRKYKCW